MGLALDPESADAPSLCVSGTGRESRGGLTLKLSAAAGEHQVDRAEGKVGQSWYDNALLCQGAVCLLSAIGEGCAPDQRHQAPWAEKLQCAEPKAPGGFSQNARSRKYRAAIGVPSATPLSTGGDWFSWIGLFLACGTDQRHSLCLDKLLALWYNRIIE